MSASVELMVNGASVHAAVGATVAAALLDAGVTAFRVSASGAPRGPVCGMGICHECHVTIDGVAHRRACLVPVHAGMRIETAPPAATAPA